MLDFEAFYPSFLELWTITHPLIVYPLKGLCYLPTF
jgi:hypothetical protein